MQVQHGAVELVVAEPAHIRSAQDAQRLDERPRLGGAVQMKLGSPHLPGDSPDGQWVTAGSDGGGGGLLPGDHQLATCMAFDPKLARNAAGFHRESIPEKPGTTRQGDPESRGRGAGDHQIHLEIQLGADRECHAGSVDRVAGDGGRAGDVDGRQGAPPLDVVVDHSAVGHVDGVVLDRHRLAIPVGRGRPQAVATRAGPDVGHRRECGRHGQCDHEPGRSQERGHHCRQAPHHVLTRRLRTTAYPAPLPATTSTPAATTSSQPPPPDSPSWGPSR